jgi:hypothetical protein
LQAIEPDASWYPCIFGEACFVWPIQGAFFGIAGNSLDVVCATLSGNHAHWPYNRDQLQASAFATLVFWRVGIPCCYSTSGFLSGDWNQKGFGNANI